MTESIFLKCISGQKTERPPVWMMRQAGRILPEYRALRKSVDGFKSLVQSPELAAEVTLQPVNALNVDAAIFFSDILVIPEAMGMDYKIQPGVGPVMTKTVLDVSPDQLIRGEDAASQLSYVYDGISATRKMRSDIPLIGFSGCPWTLLAYMVEGGGSKTFSRARRFLYQNPKESHNYLEALSEAIIAYLKNQIKAGVCALQLFDSWAGLLGRELYEEFSLRYITRICASVSEVPLIVFAKGLGENIDLLDTIPNVIIGIDWMTAAQQARKKFGADRMLQGNLDPAALYADPEKVNSVTLDMLNNFGRNHIANLGHGVYPDTPLHGVKAFVNAVQNYRYN